MRIRPLTLTWLLYLSSGSVWAQSSPPTSAAAPVTAAPTATPTAAPVTTNDTSTADALATSAEDDEKPRTEARDRFASGLKLYDEGEFALALIEFERAYSLIPNHRVLYNIGQVSIQLGRYARAVRTLRQYLADGGDEVPLDRRQSVSNDLTMLASRTALLLVNVSIPGAEILLNNDVVASSPMTEALLVDAGEHRLTVRKPGFLPHSKPLALAGRDTVTLDVTLTAEPKIHTTEKTVILERKASGPSAELTSRNRNLLLGWSATGLLGAAWATTGYFGYSTAQDREAALEGQTTARKLEQLDSRAKHWYLASDLLGLGTLLSAGGMLYYTLATDEPSKPPSTNDRKAPTPPAATIGRASIRRLVVSASPRMLTISGQF